MAANERISLMPAPAAGADDQRILEVHLTSPICLLRVLAFS